MLIWSYNPKTGALTRVSSDVARERRVHADPDAHDLDIAIEFHPGAADTLYEWRAPEFPKKPEAS